MPFLFEELKNKDFEDFIKPLRIKKTIKSPINNLSPGMLADGFSVIEAQDLLVKEVLMNAYTYADLRKYGKNILDLETDVKRLKEGIMAYLWGATIIVLKKIPEHTAIVLSEPAEKLAVILKIKEGHLNTIYELQKETEILRELLNSAISKIDIINSAIYEITKTEE